MTRLKLIKKLTSDWFDSHKFVNQVYWGDFIRWYADKQIQHSSVVITPIRVTEVTRSKRSIQLQITYADRVYSDFRNLDEVHSDADRTLADFILSASNDKELRKYLTGLTSGNIEYFTNRTGDLIAGATMSVSLNVFSDANSCEIPIDFAPQPAPFECLDATFTISDSQGNLIDSGSIPSGGNEEVTLPEIWWERPEGWLDMPTITALENKFAGLYAVFEDGFNAVAIRLVNGLHTIDWGDGATDSGSGTVIYNHVYDYASISGAVLVSDDGRNYKQVMVEVGYDATTFVLAVDSITTPTTGTDFRQQNWLEILVNSTNASSLIFDTQRFGYRPIYLQKIKGISNVNLRTSPFASSLKVVDIDFSIGDKSNFLFNFSGNIRADDQGTPLDVVLTNAGFQNGLFQNTSITKIGNVSIPNSPRAEATFRLCGALEECGDFSAPLTTTLSDNWGENYRLKTVGTITVGADLTAIARTFLLCYALGEIIFAGDMSGVTITFDAFRDNYSLRRLILPNITVGFDIRDSQVTGTNLQDLQTSVGTADGVQTITLPLFVDGEDVSTFISKGYTIAYA